MTVFGKSCSATLCALAFAFAARFVAMAFLPLTDPTEGRYAQVAQEMVVTRDWVTPQIWMNEAHVPFMGKPPLFFWAEACAMRIFGVNEFSARLPSLLATLALLWLLYRVMERYCGSGSGQVSVLMTATCGFLFAMTGVVAVDLLLAACVAGSLLAYFAFTCESSPRIRGRWSLLVFFLLALGFLTKGPVAVVLFGLPVLAWTVRWREWKALRDHRWMTGILLFLVLVAPWFILSEHRNPGFMKYFFLNENLLRFVKHDYGDAYGTGHMYMRGTALLMFVGATAPWCLLGFWRSIRSGSVSRVLTRTDKQAGFLFLGFAVGTLFWCLARQLLTTYMLPMVPLFAAWLAFTMREEAALRRKLVRTASLLLAVMGLITLVCTWTLQNTASSRQIVRVAQRYAAEKSFKGPLLFARKTPYSAHFYARGWVLPHPKETLRESLARCRGLSDSALVVVSGERKKEIQELAPDSWTRLASAGHWTLLRVALPASVK